MQKKKKKKMDFFQLVWIFREENNCPFRLHAD